MTKSMVSTERHPAARSHHPAFRRKLVIGASIGALFAGTMVPLYAHSASAPVAQTAQTQATVLPSFSDLVEKVKPAVFAVKVRIDPSLKTAQNDADQARPFPFQGENPFKGTPFEHFFDGNPSEFRGGPGDRDHHGPMMQGLGSGFFISPDGYAVTNNHVVDGAAKVEIVTDDGKTYKAKVVGVDPKTDLAVIKVDGHDFPFVKIAEKAPKIGEWVLAVGNPFGLGGTVTAGIVSAQNRDIGSGPYDDYIQIDAPVNRGNSGGPTFNLAGEVIGVNTAIYSPSGGSVGIAFDIPSTTLNRVIPVLQKNGRVERAWLGVRIQAVTDDISESLGLSSAKGAIIDQPEPGSPAEKAELKAGDVILKVDGKDVKDARDLARMIGRMAPDTRAELTVLQNGKEHSIRVALGAMKDDTQKLALADTDHGSRKLEKLGLSVEPASKVNGAGDKGLAVVDVDPAGPAADMGIELGDVILKVGERDIASAKDLRQALSDVSAQGRKKALALIKRGNDERYITLPTKSSLS